MDQQTVNVDIDRLIAEREAEIERYVGEIRLLRQIKEQGAQIVAPKQTPTTPPTA